MQRFCVLPPGFAIEEAIFGRKFQNQTIPKLKENVMRNACDCPSGRLVIIDKQTGKTIEPSLEKSIGFIEDQGIGVDGPIWVRGNIPVYSAEGKLYEVRNRVTLCRCGKSTNKPFCDSSHYPEGDQEVIEDEQK